MLKEDADRDLRDLSRRIEKQLLWIELLRSLGQATETAEDELAELRSALDHIAHHRAVLAFSLRGLAPRLIEQGA